MRICWRNIEILYHLGFDVVLSVTPGASFLENLLVSTQENLIASSRAISQFCLGK